MFLAGKFNIEIVVLERRIGLTEFRLNFKHIGFAE